MVTKKQWVILACLLVVAVGSILLYRRNHTVEISYREIVVDRKDVSVTVLATGTVQPQNRVEIKPPVAGRVEQVIAKEGQKVRKGQVLAWMSSTERAALLDAARAQGAEVLKKWEENYKPTPILAPIHGTVILRSVESGQTFTSTDSVFAMSDRLTVKAQVDETDIAQVRSQQKAKIVLDAYPNETLHGIHGYVDQIAFEAKTVNNVTTYDVDVLPQVTPDFMRSGMTANVTFFVTSKENIIAVPNEALHLRDNQYFVNLKNAEASPIDQAVQTGITNGKVTEITEGLSEGQIILVAEMKPLQRKQDQNKNPFAPALKRGKR